MSLQNEPWKHCVERCLQRYPVSNMQFVFLHKRVKEIRKYPSDFLGRIFKLKFNVKLEIWIPFFIKRSMVYQMMMLMFSVFCGVIHGYVVNSFSFQILTNRVLSCTLWMKHFILFNCFINWNCLKLIAHTNTRARTPERTL